MNTDPTSPAGRVRARFEKRQQARYLDVEIFDDGNGGGELIARVRPTDDEHCGRIAMLVLAAIRPEAQIDLAAEDLALMIAASTIGLYTRDEDGELEPLQDNGVQLTFAQAGALLGLPEMSSPEGGVMAAFSEGEPSVLNATRLVATAQRVAAFLVTGQDAAAQAAVKGPSAPAS